MERTGNCAMTIGDCHATEHERGIALLLAVPTPDTNAVRGQSGATFLKQIPWARERMTTNNKTGREHPASYAGSIILAAVDHPELWPTANVRCF